MFKKISQVYLLCFNIFNLLITKYNLFFYNSKLITVSGTLYVDLSFVELLLAEFDILESNLRKVWKIMLINYAERQNCN